MADERPKAELLIDMINNHLSVDDVKKRIQEMEAEYDTDYFLDYDIEYADIERKPKQDWDEEYYEKVKTKGILGIASKQYFLYFAEVNEYIHNKRDEEQRKKKRRKLMIFISAVVIAAIMIAIFIMLFNGTDAGAADILNYQPIASSAYNNQSILNL